MAARVPPDHRAPTTAPRTAPGGSTSGDQELSLAMALLAELVQDGDEENKTQKGPRCDSHDHHVLGRFLTWLEVLGHFWMFWDM